MLKIIIWREFLAHIFTLRFLLGLIICTALVSLNTWVLVRSYTHRLGDYRRAVDANASEVRNILTYSQLSNSHSPRAEKKPPLLSILNEGLEGRLGNSVKVSHVLVPVHASRHGSDNPYLVVFPRTDLTFVFQIVISLLAFLISYDVIAGERQSGTLALVMSNAVPRGKLLFGKYLGGMLSLAIPLVFSLLAALLFIIMSPYVVISASDWARIGIFCLISLIYMSVFYTLGMLFSTWAGRATTALILTMFVWALFVLIFPRACAFAVSKLMPIRSESQLSFESYSRLLFSKRGDPSRHPLHELSQKFERELEEFKQKRNFKLLFNGSMSSYSLMGHEYVGSLVGAPNRLPTFHEILKFQEELNIQYADEVDRLRTEFLIRNPIRQAKLTQQISSFSPASVYWYATAVLTETDLESHLRFLDEVRNYRNELIRYLRDQKAFDSEAWYNPKAFKKIDAGDIPLFREHPESLLTILSRISIYVGLLVLLNLVFFLLTCMLFLRSDVS
ncbi:MAG: ABC transporter permease subunit [Candidatus Poribacteria bacterium]|nr:ABC transporter permease subunit [Candidatus Poribacteria bacterium]MDE0506375.1 ABC transporter permease subunit [Candidatus Poribacteria bacterium]